MNMRNVIFLFLILLTTVLASCSKSDTGPDQNPEIPKEDSPSLHDKSFTSVGGNGWTAALQADGKVVAAGSFGTVSNYAFKIYRFNKDGGIDNSFDIDVDKTWKINSFSAIAVLSDGKIMVGGDFTINGSRKILVKLNPNGALDNSFVAPNFNIASSALTSIRRIIDLGADRILLAGNFNVFTAQPRVDFNQLIKITYAGLLDNSYQANLLTTTSLTDVLQQNDGKLLISGTNLTWGNGGTPRHAIARLNANGSQDLSFNFRESLGGIIPGSVSGTGYITAMALQSDGKIVIGGPFVNIENTAVRDGIYNYTQLARLNTDGSPDLTFKISSNNHAAITDLEILPDNRILAGRGLSLAVTSGSSYLRLYSKDGDADNSFNLGYNDSYINQIIKQENGKYILIGEFTTSLQQGLLRITIK